MSTSISEQNDALAEAIARLKEENEKISARLLRERLAKERERLVQENILLKMESCLGAAPGLVPHMPAVVTPQLPPQAWRPESVPWATNCLRSPVQPWLGDVPAVAKPDGRSGADLCAADFEGVTLGGSLASTNLGSSLYSSMASSDGAPESLFAGEARTTVMMRNIPNNYSRDMLLELLDQEGFSGAYNLVYLPIDFSSNAGFGYAFVNFVATEHAERFMAKFHGFRSWSVPSEKVCDVVWSMAHQGLEAHVERYRNSPMMREYVPDEFKPVLLVDGVRVPFPLPTKKIRAHRARRQ